ncbi:EcsC family protein [Klenkia taihuensis]|uniref:EcsC protein family protein n=1 Tax=Klenkia taihuensis TaxID=1225127 RepID=A0A1I1Q3W5_9ACTN|nr:EcsC family protein [Klenkia taihuensis]GHE08369.1 hypothetical protein GCM10011381_08880 [Klenkia taihuensis]SFD14558.1 EcsC protein family protein [Klenkia taihuensis]
MTELTVREHDESKAQAVVSNVLAVSIKGKGPFKSAQMIADEHLARHGDVEKAVQKVIATHTRLVGMSGFATGLGGLLTLPITVPTDVGVFYMQASRCAAAVAHLRGYDLDSDEVRSIVAMTTLGASGVAIAAEFGVDLGTRAAVAALKKVPGRVLIDINKKVGFRLVTKAGTTGVVNLTKLVPLVGGGVGSSVNVVGMRSIGRYATRNFPVA